MLSTGEQIAPRQGVTPEPGALLVRVAASHLRVGTFEYATWHLDQEVRERLVEHTIQRHHPVAEGPLGLLEAVTAGQAELVAQWMLLGLRARGDEHRQHGAVRRGHRLRALRRAR